MANPDQQEAAPAAVQVIYMGLQQGGSPPDGAYLHAPPFQLDGAGEAAFTMLKVLLTTAPVLAHPDPTWQFVVEVDVLDTGVGAVLS